MSLFPAHFRHDAGSLLDSPARASHLFVGLFITSFATPSVASETTKATRWVALERVAMPLVA
jgi:hypothetical protein